MGEDAATVVAGPRTRGPEPVAPRAERSAGWSSPVRTFLVLGSAYLVMVALVGAWMASRNAGHFSYALDDPYIHLAIARNLVEHGTWGIDPGIFESASSSPAWTVLVATGLVVAPVGDVWVPLLLAVASGLALIWQVVRIDPFRRLPAWARWSGLVVACLPLGLVHLTFIGMEHLLHAALVLAIVSRAGALFGPPDAARVRDRQVLLALLAVAALVRFETAFLAVGLAVAVVVAAAPASRLPARARRALPLLIAGFAPLLVVALVNVAFGQLLLPNSIVVKTAAGEGGTFGVLTSLVSADTWRSAVIELARAPEVTILLAAVLVVLATTWRSRWEPWQAAALAVCVAAALTVVFGDLGWFGRYNVWLVAACYGVLGPLAADPPPELPVLRRRPLAAWLLVLVVVAAPVQLFRASWLPAAGSEIYRQQGQMARFLAENYPGEAVAVSDLGFVAWRHDGPELDLWGLASVDVARAVRSGEYDPAFMDELAAAHDVRAIVIYEAWFENMREGIPESWVPVERWCLADSPQRVVGGKCVTWFGRTPEDADALRARLEADRSLPDGITYDVLDGN